MYTNTIRVRSKSQALQNEWPASCLNSTKLSKNDGHHRAAQPALALRHLYQQTEYLNHTLSHFGTNLHPNTNKHLQIMFVMTEVAATSLWHCQESERKSIHRLHRFVNLLLIGQSGWSVLQKNLQIKAHHDRREHREGEPSNGNDFTK